MTLVTGLSGFVGRHIHHAFDDVVPLEVDGGAVDLVDASSVERAVAESDPRWVVHLAARSSVAEALADPSATWRTNVLGTMALLEALRRRRFAGRLLYVSSGDVYGHVAAGALPLGEERTPVPANPYASSKVAAEALCRAWGESYGLDIVLARPFNHVGPGQDSRFALGDFSARIAAAARQGADAELMVGDIDVTRDFTDVRDVVSAYRRLLERGRSGQTYNVCSGVERSVRDAVGTLARLARVGLRLTGDPSRLRPSDQRRVRGDPDKIARECGWQPTIAWEQTLSDMLDFWKREIEP